MAYLRPHTPADVGRSLRQESGFGCARCGHPYIEYHHIIPFSEDAHFRVKDMVALCANCHPMLAKQGRDRQYDTKNNPYNKKNGIFRGALEYDKRDLVFKVGGNWYENTPIIFQVGNIPMIACRLDEGQAMVSINLFDQQWRPVLSVVDNQVAFRVDDIWDFSYSYNYAVVRSAPREIVLEIDFRGADATINGRLWVGNNQVRLMKEETNLSGSVFRGNRMVNCGVGIHLAV